jgi:hypothetical protein
LLVFRIQQSFTCLQSRLEKQKAHEQNKHIQTCAHRPDAQHFTKSPSKAVLRRLDPPIYKPRAVKEVSAQKQKYVAFDR